MKILIIFGLWMSVLPSCGDKKNESKDKASPNDEELVTDIPAGDGISIENYGTFLGFKIGDTLADVKQTFGEPSRNNSDAAFSFHTHYFDTGDEVPYLRISTRKSDDTIYTIGLELEAVSFLKEKDLLSEKLKPLGVQREELIRMMGKPADVNSETPSYQHTFKNKSDRQKIQLTVSCYEFWDDQCRSITLYWFENRS